MIGLAIGAAAGALGGLFGGLGKNAAIRKQMELLKQQQQENKNWYDRRYNEDATQRADAQRILQITEDRLRKTSKAAAGREAVMGGATEETARAKEAGTQVMADAVGQITAANEKRKDQIEQQYLQKKNEIDQQKAALEGQKQGGLDMVGNIIGGAGQGAGMGAGIESLLGGKK